MADEMPLIYARYDNSWDHDHNGLFFGKGDGTPLFSHFRKPGDGQGQGVNGYRMDPQQFNGEPLSEF